jgi:TonB-linked SusC/RagA family outer membrane protein
MGKFIRIALLFVLTMAYTLVWAQGTGTTVTGTVSDDKGAALPGVTVTVKDANISTLTNADGKYSIRVPANGLMLVFTYIGSEAEQVLINSRSVVNVTLKQTSTALSDVVVIGYGTQKRGDVNGAISSVRAADIANIPQVSIDQLLQGKAAGLSISQNSGAPGSNTSVRIRGITSFGSSEPLYVIDGVPVSGDATNSSTTGRPTTLNANNGQTSVSPLALINPSDIESVDILKDASAAAIYGNRAANGVIIITTKRGKTGTARINYDGYIGVQQPQKYLKLMKLPEYASLQNSLADVYGSARRAEFADPALLGDGTDWQREIFRNALQQSHQVSVSGGKEGINYYLSGNYLGQEGIGLGTEFKRYTFRTNIDAQVKSWFKLGFNLSGNRTGERIVYSDNGGLIYNGLLQVPDVAVYNADGTFAGPPNTPDAVSGTINPVAQALSINNRLNRSNVNGNIYSDLRFFKDLTLRSEIGGDFNYSDSKVFTPTYSIGRFINPTATLQEQWQQSTYYNWKEYLTYTHIFAKKHNVTATLGSEVQASTWNGIQAGVQNFLSNTVQTLNLGDALTATNSEFKGSQSLGSQYARLIYDYNNKYSLTATIRRDESSKFAEGNRVGYFPSFALSWRLSEEPFLASIKSVADNVKLRLGFGETGNQDIPNYRYGSAISSTVTGLGTGYFIAQISNPELTWQHSIQYNAGLDFSVLNNRVDASVDYFIKRSDRFLFQLPLPAFLVGEGAVDAGYLGGISPPFFNAGEIENKGVDLTINAKNFIGKNFKWNTTLVFSQYTNRVLSLANGQAQLLRSVTNGFLSLPVTKTVVGGPIGEFFGYRVKDIFRTPEQLRTAPMQFGRPIVNGANGTWLGDIQYQDLNGNNKIDQNDQESLGNPNPKFTYGLTNSFSYKAFDLSLFVYGSYGAKILSVLQRTLGGLSSLYQNQYASAADYWSPANANSKNPAPKSGTDNPNLQISDRFIQSGSFLRIQNINIGYTLPVQLAKKVKMNRLRAYASIQNLYTFTKYNGYDPEIGSSNQSPLLTNVDLGRYPIPRTFTFGLNAEF